MILNNKKIEKSINLKEDTNVYENVEMNIFDIASQMYIYLNFCPKLVLEKSDWIIFFVNILDRNFPLHKAVLILNRLTKTNTSKDIKQIAFKLLAKITKKMKLQHEAIEKLTTVEFT